MRHFISLGFTLFFAAIFMASCGTTKKAAKAVSAEKTEYQVVHFGFYNFENLFDTIDTKDVRDAAFSATGDLQWNTPKYFEKQGHIAKVVSEMGVKTNKDGLAFFGVAEVENRSVLDDFVKQPAVAKRHYKIVHYDSPDKRGIDVALLYQEKYLKVLDSRTYKLTIINEDGSEHPTRDVLYVYGELLGEPIHIMVNHWPSRSGGEARTRKYRNDGAAICKKISDSIMVDNPKAHIVIMGDLNDDPVSPSVKKVLGAKENKDKVKSKGFYNPWVKPYKNGQGTLAYRDAWSLFDQVILSEGWLAPKNNGFKFYKAHVYNPSYLIQQVGQYRGYPFRTFAGGKYIGGYSDHFPVYVTTIRKSRS